MTARNPMKSLARGAATLMFGIAGLSFLWGGRALHEFWGVDRTLGELEGIGLAALCGIFGFAAKTAGESDDDQED